jgi:hypothetical protein
LQEHFVSCVWLDHWYEMKRPKHTLSLSTSVIMPDYFSRNIEVL